MVLLIAWCFAAAVIATFLWGGVVRGFGVLFAELKTEFRMSTFLLSLVVALHVALFTVGGTRYKIFIDQSWAPEGIVVQVFRIII